MSNKMTFVDVLREADKNRDGGLTVAGHFMQVAAQFDDLEKFETACKAAEADRKNKINERLVKEGASKEVAAQMLKQPGAWSQAKSNVRNIWKKGRHPKEFKSYSELTIELNKMRKADRGVSSETAGEAGEGKNPATSLKEAVKGLTHANRIERMVNTLMALADGDQAECLDEFEKILADYSPKADTSEQETQVLEDGDFDNLSDSETLREVEAAQIAAASM